jgi:hypothetical protein
LAILAIMDAGPGPLGTYITFDLLDSAGNYLRPIGTASPTGRVQGSWSYTHQGAAGQYFLVMNVRGIRPDVPGNDLWQYALTIGLRQGLCPGP